MLWQDPRVVSVTPFIPPAFEVMQKNGHFLPTATDALYKNGLNIFHAVTDVSIERITYRVDDLHITGALLTPRHIKETSQPLLIYNRGGSGQFGILNIFVLALLAEYAREGYIILASNYRGNDGSDGKDEFGGADVRDVVELLDIGRTHPAWDGKNAFMYGHSRGAMMTFLAIKHGAALSAAAAVAGPTHCDDLLTERPDMINVYRRYIPQYDENTDTVMRERSAVHWVDALNVPLLIVHGDVDDRVNISHAHALDAALTLAGKSHKTVIYPGGDHSLMRRYRNESMQEIKAWFARYST